MLKVEVMGFSFVLVMCTANVYEEEISHLLEGIHRSVYLSTIARSSQGVRSFPCSSFTMTLQLAMLVLVSRLEKRVLVFYSCCSCVIPAILSDCVMSNPLS